MSKQNYPDSHEYLGLRVEVIRVSKPKYNGLAHTVGTVTKANGNTLGIQLDGYYNKASQDGTYWFKKHEVKIIDEDYLLKQEVYKQMKPENYPFIAVVTLLEDTSNKQYDFALYTDDYINLKRKPDGQVEEGNLVVVNPRLSTNRVLGRVIRVFDANVLASPKPQAQVVGVVNMDRFQNQEAEEQRLADIIKVRKQLDEEIEKLSAQSKDSKYYDRIVSSITLSPGDTITGLLSELRSLEQAGDK